MSTSPNLPDLMFGTQKSCRLHSREVLSPEAGLIKSKTSTISTSQCEVEDSVPARRRLISEMLTSRFVSS